MFAPSSTFIAPRNSLQPLWRYLSYDRLIELIESEELFFTHLPIFSDGREGLLTKRSRDRLFDSFYNQYQDATTAHSEVTLYEKHHEHFYASCWHMNNSESYLMWKVYGDRGCAIKTTLERACASFQPFVGTVQGGVVQYVDFEREETPLGNVFTHVITKDIPYEDEREYRFMVWCIDPENSTVTFAEKGVRVRVNLKMLIEEVIINPFEGEPPLKLMKLLEEKSIKCSAGSSKIIVR